MNIADFNILLVVVLYNEKLWDCNTYKTLIQANNFYPVFVYDNSPIAQHHSDDFPNNFHYISDPSNRGLSYAYNRAAQYAQSSHLEWVLVLDQDTIFPDQILSLYIEAINNGDDFVLCAPFVHSSKSLMSPTSVRIFGKVDRSISGKVDLGVTNLINSGMCINVCALQKVGGYNERVFLDFSDYEFLRRLRGGGYKWLYLLDADCFQSFSNEVQVGSSKLSRFALFCRCLASCDRHTIFDRIHFTYQVLKRAFSLILTLRSFSPLRIFWNNYLFL